MFLLIEIVIFILLTFAFVAIKAEQVALATCLPCLRVNSSAMPTGHISLDILHWASLASRISLPL